MCSVGVTLVEIPSANPTYTLNSTVTRFPSGGLQTLCSRRSSRSSRSIKIQPLQAGYPAIYLSDRRCTVGGQLYQARLIEFDGISQGMGNESDDASFTFGNADRVMRDLANDVDLYRAAISFSLFHVGQGIKLDLWKGDIVNWSLRCRSGVQGHRLRWPVRTEPPVPDAQDFPHVLEGVQLAGVPVRRPRRARSGSLPDADASKCDKNYDTPNGCLAHGMKRYYGAILAEPQGVRIKDNSTGVWGFGRSTLTSVSLVADSIYDQVLPEVYTDTDMPVNCKVAAGRDESDFYEALGIVGEGPLVAYTRRITRTRMATATRRRVGHTLDGQAHHGFPANNSASGRSWATIRLARTTSSRSTNPATRRAATSARSTPATPLQGQLRGGHGVRRDPAGRDAKGLQLSKPGDHAMIATVQQGMSGWVWTSPGVRVYGPPLTNPVWIAINMLLRARGLRLGADATTQQLDSAETSSTCRPRIDAATICNDSVTKLVGAGSETQFAFRGTLQEEKPLRDWLQEVLMNCLGYYTFSFGKLSIGVRENSSVVEAFTEGNILFRSLQLAPLKPSFNHLTANFADQDFAFVNNSVAVYDIDHAIQIGGGAGPMFLKSSVNLCRHIHQESRPRGSSARGCARSWAAPRRGVEGGAADRRSRPRSSRSTRNRGWSAR